MHFILAGALALNSALFVIANPINYEFLSIGFVSCFLAVVEIVSGLKRKGDRSVTMWENERQRIARKLGIVSIFIGTLLSFYGLFELNTTIMGCNAYSCGSLPSSYYVSFYGGLGIIAIGGAFVLVSKFMTLKTEKWREQILAARKSRSYSS